MKTLAITISALLILGSCALQKDTKGENREETVKLGKSFGPTSVNVQEAVDAADIRKMVTENGGETELTFKGAIFETCSKAGCWVNIDEGNGNSFMVRFKDHFTIPTDTPQGTIAFFHGAAFNDTVSVELLQHFAEDAGKSQAEIDAITEPSINLGFTADGVVLEKL
tara:strand:- start:453 stop:953 length:501 start_codon:yes stop_codon:yes gene_type:complete